MYMAWLFLLLVICDYSCHGHSTRRSWQRQPNFWGSHSKNSRTLILEHGNRVILEPSLRSILWQIRGGEAATDATTTTETTADVTTEIKADGTTETKADVTTVTTNDVNFETTATTSPDSEKPSAPQLSLDQRVRAALQKFGLMSPPSPPPPPPTVELEPNETEPQQVPPKEELNDSIELVERTEVQSTLTQESPLTEQSSSPTPECDDDGVCTLPTTAADTTSSTATVKVTEVDNVSNVQEEIVTVSTASVVEVTEVDNVVSKKVQEEIELIADDDEDFYGMAQNIAKDMGVHISLAMAALGATRPSDESTVTTKASKQEHLEAARTLIQQELERINQISDDAPEVQQLVSEGYDKFLSRRALAFAEMNMDDARAILLADQMDEEEEEARLEEAQLEAAAKERDEAEAALAQQPLTTVHTNFDPAQLPATSTPAVTPKPEPQSSMPKPAKRSDVVFEATAAQVQELVLESPVPVLLDIYADWCGPCKVLGPALEDMAIKAGGAFRLVKINSDREKVISTALEVTALPTVFGIRDGRIVHMFQGIPRSDDMIKNFMMNLLMPAGYGPPLDPPITAQQKAKYAESSLRLAKMAGASCWPFAARERLQDRVLTKLDDLIQESGGMAQADDSARMLRSLLSNVIRDPYDTKFRKVNLSNKVLAQKLSPFPSGVAILRAVGFASEDSNTKSNNHYLWLKPSQKVINIAPLVVARDCIDKWIDKNRYEIAVASRKRKDELDRARLAEEAAAKAAAAAAAGEDNVDNEEESDEDATLPANSCTLKIRLEGKKKIREVVLDGDQPLRAIFDSLPSIGVDKDAEIQLTCAAKRLVIKSSDDASMDKSLAELGLLPTASFVVKIATSTTAGKRRSPGKKSKSRLTERAAAQKSRKKGSHTMQSIGIYAKDDNNKAELIDGGGGVWYEHDVTDDEGESDKVVAAATDDKGNNTTKGKGGDEETESDPEDSTNESPNDGDEPEGNKKADNDIDDEESS